MGHYTPREAASAAPTISTTREDIARYQEELSSYIAKFNIEKREAEYLLTEARNAQDAYRDIIKIQDEKISELTMSLVRLTNRVDTLHGLVSNN